MHAYAHVPLLLPWCPLDSLVPLRYHLRCHFQVFTMLKLNKYYI